ncbi:MAG TPA: hypothetical protein GXX75_06410 [Clostridiales bacterium]|nr:hypothetical protein [Clostridiales bacterium]
MNENKIFVTGLFGMTSFFHVNAFPKEGQTIRSKTSFYEVGGKGYNQAYTAKKLGASVNFYTAIGNDFFSERLIYELEKDNFGYFRFDDIPNDFACVVIDNTSDNYVILNKGASTKISEKHISSIKDLIVHNKGVLIQNEIPIEANYRILKIAHENGLITVFDPAPITNELKRSTDIFRFCDVVKPNWGEATELTNSKIDDSPLSVASRLQDLGAKNVVITRGSQGAFVLTEAGESFCQPIWPVTSIDTTGAGDVFSAALCVSLCENKTIHEAVAFASAASAISVTRGGVISAIPNREEIYDLINKQSLY